MNWGTRAALASRAAVHGAMDYLNQALFGVTRWMLLFMLTIFELTGIQPHTGVYILGLHRILNWPDIRPIGFAGYPVSG